LNLASNIQINKKNDYLEEIKKDKEDPHAQLDLLHAFVSTSVQKKLVRYYNNIDMKLIYK